MVLVGLLAAVLACVGVGFAVPQVWLLGVVLFVPLLIEAFVRRRDLTIDRLRRN
ncbi:MAG: hypothetical protein M0014_13450 [Actinomycetota bacterium]|jgi:hypothetical protein|nr:hypothetical protein [Actinomycetota bacterium]